MILKKLTLIILDNISNTQYRALNSCCTINFEKITNKFRNKKKTEKIRTKGQMLVDNNEDVAEKITKNFRKKKIAKKVKFWVTKIYFFFLFESFRWVPFTWLWVSTNHMLLWDKLSKYQTMYKCRTGTENIENETIVWADSAARSTSSP